MVRPRKRSRSASISQALGQVPAHHTSDINSVPGVGDAPLKTTSTPLTRPRSARAKAKQDKLNAWAAGDPGEIPKSFGLWNDIKTGRWMIIPSSSGSILLFSFALYLNYFFLSKYVVPLLPGVDMPQTENPFEPLWFISYPLPAPYSTPGDTRYGKGYKDIIFLLHHIITFSFIRQSITLWILRPLAIRLGIKGSKILRFQEQAYCIIYYGTMGCWGMYLMKDLPTWYYNTSEFWIDYPHWEMKSTIKSYYLLQFAYWLQQMILIVLKIEKPRKDYYELVVHHLVTLWLIGWSYGINLTMIGNAVFVTMDLSDVFLAIAKSINYAEGPNSSGLGSAVAFTWFVAVWTYLRHYLNIIILWSVWTEFDLIPQYTRVFRPSLGVWLAPWMKYQIFIPILLIQLLNLFWYFLILRIMIRSVSLPFCPSFSRSNRS
ncbi:TLC domain-containing protein [Mrakia frigida]|uniref:TLC domain-containing protein n=1 Tax=Mrakia frigida TaxID=29902 RepID=UPI003FCC09DE